MALKSLKSKSLDSVRASVPVSMVAPVEPIVRINLNVSVSTRAKWKTAAAKQNRPLTDLIVQAMDEYLARAEAPSE